MLSAGFLCATGPMCGVLHEECRFSVRLAAAGSVSNPGHPSQRFPPDLRPETKAGKQSWVSEDGSMTIEEGSKVRIKIISATLGTSTLVRACSTRHGHH